MIYKGHQINWYKHKTKSLNRAHYFAAAPKYDYIRGSTQHLVNPHRAHAFVTDLIILTKNVYLNVEL